MHTTHSQCTTQHVRMLDYHTQGQAGSNYLGLQHHTHPCCQDTQPRDHFSKVKTGNFAVLEPKDGILRHTRMREAKAAPTQKHTKPSMVIGQPGSTATQPRVVQPPPPPTHTHTQLYNSSSEAGGHCSQTSATSFQKPVNALIQSILVE